MKYLHLRNAAALLTVGEQRLLIDPMLADVGAIPKFKLFGGGGRPNPLVPLPGVAESALATATAAVITHEHPDHLDNRGVAALRDRKLPVWTSSVDVASLQKRGLDARTLRDGALGMRVEVVRSRHARGVLGWLLGPVCGFFLAHPGEPSIYLVGDSVLTESVREAVVRLQPDVLVLPAGAANLGAGGDILFSLDEIVQLVRQSTGQVVLNHLEALDHCPTTRTAARVRMREEGLADRVHVPEDGEELTFPVPARSSTPAVRPSVELQPGFQKWLAARFT